MGRAPIAQPPGSDTLARPWRAVSGPSTTTEARIVFTRSYGASTLWTLLVSTSVTPPGLLVTSAPRSPSSLSIVRTSPRAGTFRYTERPLASSDEARMGRAAFLAPETRTSPVSRAPPLTTMFCTGPDVRRPQQGADDAYEAAPSAGAPLPACSAHRLPNSRFLRQPSLVQIL